MAMSDKGKLYVDGVGLDGTYAIRVEHANGKREFGSAREAVEGMPIPPGSSIVNVSDYEEADGGRAILSRYDKPAKVTSKAYREGWDAVFGKRGVN